MNITINNRRIAGVLNAPLFEPMLIRYLICMYLTEGHEQMDAAGTDLAVNTAVKCMKELEKEDGVCRFHCSTADKSFRYVLPIAAAFGKNSEFIISESLMNQPAADFLKSLKVHGIRHEVVSTNSIRIWGQLTAGTFLIPADANQQFISGLLFALPLLKENSVIMIDGMLKDPSEILDTAKVLESAGIKVDVKVNDSRPSGGKSSFVGAVIRIKGGQKYYLPSLPYVEGNWAPSAYYMTAAALCGGPVEIIGLNPESGQNCRKILSLLEKAGAAVDIGRYKSGNEYIKVTGPWNESASVSQHFQREHLKAFSADLSDAPELIPGAVLLAAAAEGTSCIKHVSSPERYIQILEDFGIMTWESEEDIYIEGYTGRDPLSGGTVDTMGDPYIAMMAGIASCISTGAVTIEHAEAAESVYYDFYEDLMTLRK